MNDRRRFCIYDEHQLHAVLDGMASRLAGLLAGENDFVMVGIHRRGVPLARALAERLAHTMEVVAVLQPKGA